MADDLALPDDLLVWAAELAGGALAGGNRLPGGGRKEAWALEFVGADGTPLPLFLRYDRSDPARTADPWTLHREASVFVALQGTDVIVPRVLGVHPEHQAMLSELVVGDAWFSRIADPDEALRTPSTSSSSWPPCTGSTSARSTFPTSPSPHAIPPGCHPSKRGRRPRRSHRRRASGVVALAGLAIASLACASGTERAADVATAEVRGNAGRALELVEDTMASPEARRGQELVDQLRPRLAAGPDVIIFDTEVDDRGSVTLRMAFHARGETGGGLSYDAVVARLCVELTAEPGPPLLAEIRDADCPRQLPGATGNAGNVDLTVRLR